MCIEKSIEKSCLSEAFFMVRVVAHIVDVMENKPRHVGHNLCCIVSTFHSLRSSLLFSLLLNYLQINNVVLDLI